MLIISPIEAKVKPLQYTSGTFIIRSLKVGDRTVADVRASIVDVNGPLLLGQSFLKRFNQDNAAHELILQ